MEIDSPTATTDFSDYGHVFSLDRDPSFSPKPSLQYFQDLDSGLTFSRRQFPWSHEDAHRSETLVNANPGVETFGPEPGVGFYALHAREQLKTPVPLVYGPERPPAIGYDDQGRMRSNSADDDHASVERPSRTSEFGSHLHVLSFPRSNVAAGHGGRIGQLSQQQAEQARQRRSEGACWVCRLTKRKVCAITIQTFRLCKLVADSGLLYSAAHARKILPVRHARKLSRKIQVLTCHDALKTESRTSTNS